MTSWGDKSEDSRNSVCRVGIARSLDDLAIVSQLQAEIWASPGVAAPTSLLRAMSSAGGIALLAKVGGRPVGFTYGFTGWSPHGAVYHRSHSAGVLPEYRNSGIGRALKLAQKRAVLAAGLDRIVWTFDPVQVGNAYFNLHRLGATARGFQRNFYGRRDDALSRTGPTDRLFAEWFLGASAQAELVRIRRASPRATVVVPVGLPADPGTDLKAVLRRQAPLRTELEEGFASGLHIVDFAADSRSYRFAELPSSFPAPVEGGVGSVVPSRESAAGVRRRRSTSSSPP